MDGSPVELGKPDHLSGVRRTVPLFDRDVGGTGNAECRSCILLRETARLARLLEANPQHPWVSLDFEYVGHRSGLLCRLLCSRTSVPAQTQSAPGARLPTAAAR